MRVRALVAMAVAQNSASKQRLHHQADRERRDEGSGATAASAVSIAIMSGAGPHGNVLFLRETPRGPRGPPASASAKPYHMIRLPRENPFRSGWEWTWRTRDETRASSAPQTRQDRGLCAAARIPAEGPLRPLLGDWLSGRPPSFRMLGCGPKACPSANPTTVNVRKEPGKRSVIHQCQTAQDRRVRHRQRARRCSSPRTRARRCRARHRLLGAFPFRAFRAENGGGINHRHVAGRMT